MSPDPLAMCFMIGINMINQKDGLINIAEGYISIFQGSGVSTYFHMESIPYSFVQEVALKAFVRILKLLWFLLLTLTELSA